MPVIVNLDVMLARRKVRSKELAEAIGITESNLSLLKSGRVKGVRFGRDTIRTETVVYRSHTGTVRRIEAEHRDFDKFHLK